MAADVSPLSEVPSKENIFQLDPNQLYQKEMMLKFEELTQSVKRIQQNLQKKLPIEFEKLKVVSSNVERESSEVQKKQGFKLFGESDLVVPKEMPTKKFDISKFMKTEKEDKKDQSFDLPRNMNKADFLRMLSKDEVKV